MYTFIRVFKLMVLQKYINYMGTNKMSLYIKGDD
nr:MAG TPA: hypothetical protein [Caudoviricetes sp.]